MTATKLDFAGVHLVGSMHAEDAGDALRIVADRLGSWIKRVSDGAAAPDQRWLFSEGSLYYDSPDFELLPGKAYDPINQVRLKDGVGEDIRLGELRYARQAKAAFPEFQRLKAAGSLREDARFLICIPSPMTSMSVLIEPGSREAVLPHHKARVRESLEEIFDDLPEDQLAVQFDAVAESRKWAGLSGHGMTEDRDRMLAELVELGGWIPAGAELGYHFCFGDRNARVDETFGPVASDGKISMARDITTHERMHHYTEIPSGMETLAELSLALLDGVSRPIEFLHLPTGPAVTEPLSEAYQPLAPLDSVEGTEFFLGLLDLDAGLDSTRRNVEAAAQTLGRFGISPECGISRLDASEHEAALEILSSLALELTEGAAV